MNNLESGKSFSNNIAKKMAAVALVAALTVGSAGCNPKQIDSGENNNPPITGTVTPETNPTNTKPIETKTARQLELEALLTKAPEVDGLTKKIEGDKVIYANEVGEYSGYYIPEAYLEDEKTDGVCLSSPVLETMIKNNLSQGKEEYVPIPVDPSEGQIISVDFEQTKLITGKERSRGYIYISTDKSVDLINFYFGNKNLMKINTSFDDGMNIIPEFITKNAFTSTIKESDILDNFSIAITKGILSSEHKSQDFSSNVGEILGQFDHQILLLKSAYDYTGSTESLIIHESDILTINNTLVFQMANLTK